MLTWRNLKNIKEQPPITAVDSFYYRKPGSSINDATFLLFIGDEAGKVAVQDLSVILRKIENLQEFDVTDISKTGIKRNPYRIMKMPVDSNFH